jgi:hypothetical protein
MCLAEGRRAPASSARINSPRMRSKEIVARPWQKQQCLARSTGESMRAAKPQGSRAAQMKHSSSFTATLLVMVLVTLQAFTPLLTAQSASLTPQELDQLLSPIALYPDSLLSQIMTASTNPQEILDVDNWLAANPNLTGTALTDAAQQQGFDPAFIALVNFPQVLDMMAQHIDDYAAIGNAFAGDQASVTDSIQRLRAQAYAAGSLRSNAQQTVTVQQVGGQTIYVIQPANPQIVFVPQYDPTLDYVAPSTGSVVAASLLSFGAGIGLGALLTGSQPWGWGGWGWNWGARRAYYNNAYWGGWARPYRPPSVWYRPRPIAWSARPGYRGNWNYRPPAYRPPTLGSRPAAGRPPYSPANPPGSRASGQPSTTPPVAGRPNPTPPNRPTAGNRPVPPSNRVTTPAIYKPANPPATQPVRPGNPGAPAMAPGTARPVTPPANRPSRPANPAGAAPTTPRPATPPAAQPSRPANPGQPTNGRPAQSTQGGQQRPQPQPNRTPQAKPAPQPARPAPQTRPAPSAPPKKPALGL